MLTEKPTKLDAVTLANKIAGAIWALMVKGERYRAPKVPGAIAGVGRNRRTDQEHGISGARAPKWERVAAAPNRVRAVQRTR